MTAAQLLARAKSTLRLGLVALPGTFTIDLTCAALNGVGLSYVAESLGHRLLEDCCHHRLEVLLALPGKKPKVHRGRGEGLGIGCHRDLRIKGKAAH